MALTSGIVLSETTLVRSQMALWTWTSCVLNSETLVLTECISERMSSTVAGWTRAASPSKDVVAFRAMGASASL
jgi:hypothetical protein